MWWSRSMQTLAQASRRAAATQRRAHSSTPATNVSLWHAFCSRLPAVGTLCRQSTLGDVYNVLWTQYPYKLAYFPLAFTTYLWWNMWTPYAPDETKQAVRDRVAHLKKLEYHEL